MKHYYAKWTLIALIAFSALSILAGCSNPMEPSQDLVGPVAADEIEMEVKRAFWKMPESDDSGLFPSSPMTKHALMGFWGWEYEPVAKSDDEALIVGYAHNEDGFERGRWSVEAGTSVGVFWVIKELRRFSWVSRPIIIGVVEDDGSRRGYVRRKALLYGRTGMLFLDKIDAYLTTVDSIETDPETGNYLVYGQDQNGEPSVAVIDGWETVAIEPDEEEPPANQPPTVEFRDQTDGAVFKVVGAGNSAANGYYGDSGTINDRPAGEKLDGSGYYVYSTGSSWVIADALGVTAGANGLYYNRANAFAPPYGDTNIDPSMQPWLANDAADEPAPLVLDLPIASTYYVQSGGVILTEKAVRIVYEFDDPDNDGEDGTTYQWYRYSPATDSAEMISGATEEYYVPQSADAGYQLQCAVTPRDDQGNEGETVMSAPGRTVIVGG